MIRGRGNRIDILFGGRSLEEAHAELRSRLADSDFYRGTHATAMFEVTPSAQGFAELCATLEGAGIVLDGAHGEADLAAVLGGSTIAYLGVAPHPAVAALPARARDSAAPELSPEARSLVADFAGARTDLAARRTKRPRRVTAPEPAQAAAPVVAEHAAPTTLYHRGTLRGGQSLSNLGHLVVVGDVNPGAELVAGGDIVVFGALRGVAHAGAQGDRAARVFALQLAPTQLRIATLIAADADDLQLPAAGQAFVEGERIAIASAAAPHSSPREHQR